MQLRDQEMVVENIMESKYAKIGLGLVVAAVVIAHDDT
jgi:hypothetical protein